MKSKTSSKNFWHFLDSKICKLEEEGRWGTAINYSKAGRSFKRFCGDGILRFKDISPELIKTYNRYLYEKGLIRNSISQYNRVLRAVYNEAVEQELVTDRKPFRNVYTSIDKTRKRALPESEIAKIASIRVDGSVLELARDLFFFSYATCGMTFVDMAYLKKSDISENTIIYYRRKTRSRIQINLQPPVRKIVEKYAMRTVGSPYVFPILGQRSGKEAYNRFSLVLSEYNRKLKTLSNMAGVDGVVSSYVSRHSWATAARNIGADISTISEALGHKSEGTTRIYLASFDSSKIEKVNKTLVDRLQFDDCL